MTKAVWTAAAAAALLFLASTPVLAQATANAMVTVNATVAAKAKLDVTGGPVQFADADPETVTSLTATSALNISVKARTSSSGAVTLTVKSGGNLASGSDTIAINQLTWTATGAGYAAGTMATTDVSVGAFTGSGTYAGTQTYKLANSWAYNTGAYAATLTYTLTAP